MCVCPCSGVSASRLRAQSKAPRLAPSQTFEFLIYSYILSFYQSSSLSLLSCSHLSCQSNSFPFIVLSALSAPFLSPVHFFRPFLPDSFLIPLFIWNVSLHLSIFSLSIKTHLLQFLILFSQPSHPFCSLSLSFFLSVLCLYILTLEVALFYFLEAVCLIIMCLCSAPFYKIMVPTVDTVRYHYLVKALVSAQHPVLLTGPVGTGKTSVAQSVLQSLDTVTWATLTINMSSQVLRITDGINNQAILTVARFFLLPTTHIFFIGFELFRLLF